MLPNLCVPLSLIHNTQNGKRKVNSLEIQSPNVVPLHVFRHLAVPADLRNDFFYWCCTGETGAGRVVECQDEAQGND